MINSGLRAWRVVPRPLTERSLDGASLCNALAQDSGDSCYENEHDLMAI